MECWNSGIVASKGIFIVYGFLTNSVEINFFNNPLFHFPKTHYSIIPVFQYSNCEQSELNSLFLVSLVYDSLERSDGLFTISGRRSIFS